jgi:hypothetical protein
MKIGGWFGKRSGKSGSKGPPPNAPTLSSPRRFPYGPFEFRIGLSRGSPYEVRASVDLQDWTTVAEDSVSETSFERALSFDYMDPEAPRFTHRFYRVFADGVPSPNVIGYASAFLSPGFSLIANPFHTSDSSVATLFPNWPDETTLNKFDTMQFRLTDNGVQNRTWTNPHDQLAPGEGAIFFNPTPDHRPLVFVGEVMQGNLSMPIPSGFSMRSSIVAQGGLLDTDLGFPITDGDVIHLFDREKKKYVLHPFEHGKWTSDAPRIEIGESFWVAKKAPGNWTRQFDLA